MSGLTIKGRYLGLGAIGRKLASRLWHGRIDRAALGFAVLVVVTMVSGNWVIGLREAALDAAEGNLARINFVLAEDLESLFAGIDLMLAETAADAARGDGATVRLAARAARLPVVQPLAVTNAVGRVINTSTATVLTASMTVSDRTYFAEHRDHPNLGLVVRAVPDQIESA